MTSQVRTLGVLASVLLVVGGCGAQPEMRAQSQDTVMSRAPSEQAASPTTEPTQPVEDTPVICGDPGADNDLDSLTDDLVGASLSAVDGQGVSLTISDREGHTSNLGCMSAETAHTSLSLGLSFGTVLQVQDTLLLVLAVPSDRTLRTLGWMRAISAPTTAEGFDVTIFELNSDLFGGQISPTEEQIQQLGSEALEGTISTGGFGPDILTEA
jgi:hypothetical protein